MAPPRIRRGGKKLPPGAGRTAAAAKKAQADAASAAAAASNPDALEKAPQVLDPENESGDATVSMEVDQETQDAKAWIKQNVDQEVVRPSLFFVTFLHCVRGDLDRPLAELNI